MLDFLSKALAVVILVMMVGFGIYFFYSQYQIKSLSSDVAKSQTDILIQQRTIDQLKQIAEQQRNAIEELQNKTNKAEQDQQKLFDQIRNLNIIQNAQKNRPQLEKNLNNQLNGIFTDIEDATKSNDKKTK